MEQIFFSPAYPSLITQRDAFATKSTTVTRLQQQAVSLPKIALLAGIGHAIPPSPWSGTVVATPARAFACKAWLHFFGLGFEQPDGAHRRLA